VTNITTTYDVISGYDSEERQGAILGHAYDIIEFVLLAIFIIENIVKLAFTTRQTKSVSNLTFLYGHLPMQLLFQPHQTLNLLCKMC
jgi:hypothetical protein